MSAPPNPPESGTQLCAEPVTGLRPTSPRRVDLTGEIFGTLVVDEFAGLTSRSRMALWRAECRVSLGGCGRVVVRRGSDLQRQSHCGCRTWAERAPVTLDGLTLHVAGWERELRRRGLRLSKETIRARLRAGWPVRWALTTPAGQTPRRVA